MDTPLIVHFSAALFNMVDKVSERTDLVEAENAFKRLLIPLGR